MTVSLTRRRVWFAIVAFALGAVVAVPIHSATMSGGEGAGYLGSLLGFPTSVALWGTVFAVEEMFGRLPGTRYWLPVSIPLNWALLVVITGLYPGPVGTRPAGPLSQSDSGKAASAVIPRNTPPNDTLKPTCSS